ncbi:Os06g0606500 [Oryza sativa Japonica Group]|uniref:Os06g0606500 protein n=1 Tax=Oryza sativa subsp. japonica TaxID=39947 RepID=A0A0P0WZ07_ORYSJ|nr:Os06g0606500 [Oryza sativa Japonica Group]
MSPAPPRLTRWTRWWRRRTTTYGGAAWFQERRLVVVLVLPSQPMCAMCWQWWRSLATSDSPLGLFSAAPPPSPLPPPRHAHSITNTKLLNHPAKTNRQDRAEVKNKHPRLQTTNLGASCRSCRCHQRRPRWSIWQVEEKGITMNRSICFFSLPLLLMAS